MATAVVPTPTRTEPASRRTAELSVEEIINRARSSPAPARGAMGLSLLTAIPLWAAFTPLDWGPLAWVSLVPLIQLVRLPQPTRWMYRSVYAGGLVFTLAALQWMRLGDVWMYPAWIALSLYVAVYFPLFVALSRVAVHRWRAPLTIAVPVVWVGLEFARAYVMSGFAWYFLGHTQHAWTKLTQISDVTGAYGVSFVVALANASLAGFVPFAWLHRFRLAPLDLQTSLADVETSQTRRNWSVVMTLLVVVCTVAYGYLRRAQARFESGPRVALVQGNFPSSLKHNPEAWPAMGRTHFALTGLAIKERPDVIVWPETMWTSPLLEFDDGMTPEKLVENQPRFANLVTSDADNRMGLLSLSEGGHASLIVGLETLEAGPEALRRYNSALLIDSREGISGRYDKLHRVPFGEYVPFADSIPWLKQIMPFAGPLGLSAGSHVHVFNAEGHRLVPLICFEDTVPQLVRDMIQAGQKKGHKVDCLVNLTNDGWFHGSSELDQHLITASFRCIETRTPMVRAVNTGISAFIDGDGIVREPEVFLDYDASRNKDEPQRTTLRDPETGAYRKQLNAVLVSNVPLDNRRSLYVRWGDWFAALCAAACLVLLVPAKFFGLRPV
jgi:apolipoprotein N-acyltransferase